MPYPYNGETSKKIQESIVWIMLAFVGIAVLMLVMSIVCIASHQWVLAICTIGTILASIGGASTAVFLDHLLVYPITDQQKTGAA